MSIKDALKKAATIAKGKLTVIDLDAWWAKS